MSSSMNGPGSRERTSYLPLRPQLSFGLIAALVLWAGFVFLPSLVPGYDWVRQTVSEIGEMSSAARVPFALMLCFVAICVLLFAWGFRAVSVKLGRSSAAAYLTGCMAISCAGVGIFAYPHPLHGVFGLSEFVAYQAPWVLALTWRREKSVPGLVPFSWVMGVLLWAAIVANLSVLDFHSWLWKLEKPVYGVVQRLLFFTWSLWLSGISLMLMQRRAASHDAVDAALSATE